MSATDPADAVQAGVFELLATDTALMALVSGVYDGVPEGTELDYVVIGGMTSIPDGAHDGEGRQTVAELHTWTHAEGFKSANAIGARLVALLWHRHADLDPLVVGHKVWRVEHEFAQTLTDPEPGIRHRVDRFRVWTKEDAA
jgi:hypothetical protein